MISNTRLNDTYTLIEEIGAGAGGVVYKAYHERLGVYVVLKKIREQVRGRIEDRAEADILKRMKHTYLPRVYDFLEINGEVYTVIDFIPGESLDRVIAKNTRIPQKRVLAWTRQLAEALAYLHEQNPPIIHSDIKPQNIMLTPEDNICLIDFNISLALDSSMRTSTGISGGYSPPEQYQNREAYLRRVQRQRGQENARNAADERTIPYEEETESGATIPHDMDTESFLRGRKQDVNRDRPGETTKFDDFIGRGVDARSDIYSLGATLYHLLTGIKPGYDFEEIVPIDRCGVEISEGFQTIILKMMELDPDRRYQNGAELLEALRNIQELDSEYRSWRRGRRLMTAAAAGLFALGAALVVAGQGMIFRENNVVYNQLLMSAESAISGAEYAEAEKLLDEAEGVFPEKIEAYRLETLLLYSEGDYEGCIAYAQELLRNAPYTLEAAEDAAEAEIYYILGNAYLETGDYGNALLYLETALELDPDNSLYYRDCAVALGLTGNTEKAQELLQEAVDLGLGEDSIYLVQGEIAASNQEYEEAVENFLQAIACAETDSARRRAVLLCDQAYRALGTGYLDVEIALLEEEMNRTADTASAAGVAERLADAYVRKAEALASGAQEDAGSTGSPSEETAAASAEGYYRKALEQFLSLYNSGYVTSQLMENLAILYEDLDDFAKAQELLIAMAERYPDSYVPYKRLAYLEADRQQELENADRDYSAMAGYYEQALTLYDEDTADQEMEMLEIMLQELEDGGWFAEK